MWMRRAWMPSKAKSTWNILVGFVGWPPAIHPPLFLTFGDSISFECLPLPYDSGNTDNIYSSGIKFLLCWPQIHFAGAWCEDWSVIQVWRTNWERRVAGGFRGKCILSSVKEITEEGICVPDTVVTHIITQSWKLPLLWTLQKPVWISNLYYLHSKKLPLIEVIIIPFPLCISKTVRHWACVIFMLVFALLVTHSPRSYIRWVMSSYFNENASTIT